MLVSCSFRNRRTRKQPPTYGTRPSTRERKTQCVQEMTGRFRDQTLTASLATTALISALCPRGLTPAGKAFDRFLGSLGSRTQQCLRGLVKEWAEKENVEVPDDYIPLDRATKKKKTKGGTSSPIAAERPRRAPGHDNLQHARPGTHHALHAESPGAGPTDHYGAA